MCAFFGAKTHVVRGREIREDREVRENVDMEGKASFFAIGIKKTRHTERYDTKNLKLVSS